MTRRLAPAAAGCAIAAALLAAPGVASAGVHPKIGTYSGHTPDGKVLNLEVREKGGARRIRLLEFSDGCGGALLVTPLGLGKARRQFHFETSGNTTSVGYRVILDGTINSPKRMTVNSQSFVGNLFPTPGTPPGTANQCSVTSSFSLRFLPDGL